MGVKPFESTVQDLVYQVDVGIGITIMKRALAVIGVLLIAGFYTYTQFNGLNDAEAMDYAQLGRNLKTHGRLVTQCVRPLSMWYLTENSRQRHPRIVEHPDILHPPLYPIVLATAFKITGTGFELSSTTREMRPERWIIVPLGHLFTFLTAWMVFLMGRRLFDRRVGLLGMAVFFLSDSVWALSISGLNISMAMFLVSAACCAAIAGVGRHHEDRAAWQWMGLIVLSAVVCALAFLTRYGTVVLVPALAIFIGWGMKQRRWLWVLIFLAVFALGITPWLIRNLMVSGGVLGLAPLMSMNGTVFYEGNLLERMLDPGLDVSRIIGGLQHKWMTNLLALYNQPLRTIGEGLFVCFFLVAYLHRFMRPNVQVFRWCIGLSLLLFLLMAAFFGGSTWKLLAIFWPLVILYGLAFFLVLLERLQFPILLFSVGSIVIVMLLGALPLILTLLPPRAPLPYPPYFPPFVQHVTGLLAPNEVMCTDMPWATAWYGDRNSILLPDSLETFYKINDYQQRIHGLYFTTLTRDKPYARGLLTGADKSWFPILEGRIPSDFPLPDGFPLNNMDQLFLTDRPRWLQR